MGVVTTAPVLQDNDNDMAVVPRHRLLPTTNTNNNKVCVMFFCNLLMFSFLF
jgi:hypothetical protein